ncbi:MAG: membrane protein insertase YidC [Actinomycetaceae bacterium]|nr:membrane protein insertase YidC [Actinomycetaceae bacterium]
MNWYDSMLYPFTWVIGWIMSAVHRGLTAIGFDSGPGVAWVLSIVGLTILVRLVMVPLYIKQIKASRAMSLAQPEMMKLQAKYKGRKDQESQMKMMEENKAIQKKYGASMSASCLPMLVQMPVFFALYRLIFNLGPLSEGTFAKETIGGIDKQQATDFINSTVFGASMHSSFATSTELQPKIVVGILIAYLIITMLLQTKFLTLKNMSDESLNSDNPMMKSTKYMLYGMPLIYLMTGPVVQVGLLVYWATSNTWTMGQQFIFNRVLPTRGSAAARARAPKHEEKFNAYRASEEEKLETEILKYREDNADAKPKTVEIGVRELRRAHIRLLEKKRMELGLDEINLGKPDVPGRKGQRLQPGQKGWEEAQKELEEERELWEEEDEEVEIDPDVRGKDGLTAQERAHKRYEAQAAKRKEAAAKRREKEQLAKQRAAQQKKRNAGENYRSS